MVGVEPILDEPSDNAGLAHCYISHQYEFEGVVKPTPLGHHYKNILKTKYQHPLTTSQRWR